MNLLILTEKAINRIRIKSKIIYWKLKYGKKIKIGKKLNFRKRFNILIEKDAYLEIGDNNFFNNDCSINCLKNIKIGNNNIFGESVKIYDHNHVFNMSEKDLINKFNMRNIEIGNFNWIGSNVVILKNTKMEDRNVIGAGTVINQEIDSFKMIKTKNENIVEEIKVK